MRRLGFVLLSFVAGFLAGLGIKYVYEATAFQPYEWTSPPIVVNCYGKDFSELQMTRALEYWALRGFSTAFYVHEPPEGLCENEWLEGFVLLKKSNSLPESTLASTKRWTSMYRMRGAVIYYKPGSFNLYLINEHELGHAFGFQHVEKDGHIMHPMFQKMGKDFSIPK